MFTDAKLGRCFTDEARGSRLRGVHGDEFTQSIDRTVKILHGLARKPEGASVSAVARDVGLPVPTTYRILLALERHGLVEHDRETKRYRLGLALVRLSHNVLDTAGIRMARAQLATLRDAWQESFFFSELVDDHVICLDVVHPNESHMVGLYVRPGRQMPLHSSASAKAILAYRSFEVVERMLMTRPFTAFTPFTITSWPEYARSLLVTRRLGYAVCDQETQIGIVAVSVPVRDQNERAMASLTVLGAAERIKTRLPGLVAGLLCSAKLIKPEADLSVVSTTHTPEVFSRRSDEIPPVVAANLHQSPSPRS